MFLKFKRLDLLMHKYSNIFVLPTFFIGLIFLSNGLLGYGKSYYFDIENNTFNSNQINNLYSEKEITLKDPPISEILSNKLLVKIKVKPVDPKITSKIKKNYNSKTLSNLLDTDFDYLETNKREFVKTVLPIIINENQNILIMREFVNNLKNKLETFKTLNNTELQKLKNIAKKYNIKYSNKHKLDVVDEILNNVDVIPNSIALAQAAIESGWGKSRFAKEHNALFGEYTYDQNKGVVPLKRDFGEKHLIKSFSSYNNSVTSYFANINSHYAYKDFRSLRSIMRSKNNFSDLTLLINKLDSYAADDNYIHTLIAVIEKNKFNKFNSKIISY